MRAVLCVILLVLAAGPGWAQDADDEFNLARNLFRDAGDYATAAELFADFIRNHPDSPHLADARLMLARAYARTDRCGEAVGAYEEFYLQHPDHLGTAEARRERAACLEAEGQFAAAARAFAEAQQLYSASEFASQLLLDAGANYARAGDLATAVATYNAVLAGYGSSPLALTARYRLAQLYFAGGRADAAQQLLDQIGATAPKSAAARDARLLSGRIYLYQGRRESARQVFDLLLRDFPQSAAADSARLDLASDLYAAGDFTAAAVAFRRARDGATDPSLKQRARLGLADALRYGSDYAGALEIYTGLVDESSPDAALRDAALLGQAICFGQTGRRPAAVRLFQDLIQSGAPGAAGAPGTAGADTSARWTAAGAASLRELGALYRRGGDLTRAITWYRRYLDEAERSGSSFPESPFDRDRTRLQLAQVYDAAGFHDEAATAYAALTGSTRELAAEAQYGLAATHEQAGERDLAIREYTAFLERFPVHRRAEAARERIEYLTQFAIVDPEGLNQALQQALIDELSGRPRQRVLLELARALRLHQDHANAVRTFETYAAAYPDDPSAAEAQYFLADGLHRLARQRRLEARDAEADSLLELALKEDRILAGADRGEWSAESQLRLAETIAARAPQTQRDLVLEQGYRGFLADHPPVAGAARPARARALVGLGDVLWRQGATDSARYGEAVTAYQQVLAEPGAGPLRSRARYGLGRCRLAQGRLDAAVDTLQALLRDVPDPALQPDVLHLLARALRQRGDAREAVARYQELLLAFPAYSGRRAAQEELADSHFGLGEFALAAELYRQLWDGDPLGDPAGAVRPRLAASLHRQGQYAAALDLYTRLLDEQPGAAAADSLHLARGQLLVAVGRPEEALTEFAGIVRRTPPGPLAGPGRRQRADLLFDLGRYGAAYDEYAPLLGRDEADLGTSGRAVVSLYLADRFEAADKAADAFHKRFGKATPWSALFRLEEGEYLLRHRQWDKALKLFAELADSPPPTGAPAAVGAGSAHLRQLAADPATAATYLAATARWEQSLAQPTEEGRVRALEAQTAFVQKHADSPFSAPVHLRLGSYYFTLGQYLPAAGAYRRAVEGEATLEEHQEAIWMLLECYVKAFEFDQAQRTAARLLREYPRPSAGQCRAAGDRLHSHPARPVPGGHHLSRARAGVGPGQRRRRGPVLHRPGLPADGRLPQGHRALLPRQLPRHRGQLPVDHLGRLPAGPVPRGAARVRPGGQHLRAHRAARGRRQRVRSPGPRAPEPPARSRARLTPAAGPGVGPAGRSFGMEIALLRRVPLFEGLADADLSAIARVTVPRTYDKDQVIILAEEEGDALFIIAKGQVKVSILSEDGREVILSLLGEGAVFGELALLDGKPRSANVVATRHTELYMVRRSDFLQLIYRVPQIAIALLAELASRLRRTDRKIEGLALLDVTSRISETLLQLAADSGRDAADGIVLESRPTHQQLASMSGTTRETVSRVLKRLETRGYLRVEGRTITIRREAPWSSGPVE
ncbi:MAG: tetratricopeptide repeat protein [Gemmatimonadota bacterium]